MIIFTTDRLVIKELEERDKDFFIELLSAPEIIEAIPQAKWSIDEILSKFNSFTNYTEDPLSADSVIWGVFEKNRKELIGLSGILMNNENQREIAYRFRKKYWGKGYGTELVKSLIDYSFHNLDLALICADVSIENLSSVRILEKYFKPGREFYNKNDNCVDRRYSLNKEDWIF